MQQDKFQLYFVICHKRTDTLKLMVLRRKLLWHILPIFLLLLFYHLLLTEGYMKSVRIEEIPFGLTEADRHKDKKVPGHSGIYAISHFEDRRAFFHLFHVPYILCFFAAKGKWPFIPPFMQGRVDAASRTLFTQNDTFIKQFCQKWIQIKECFRPLYTTATTPINIEVEKLRSTACTCANLVSPEPVVYFDKNYIGNVSSETILNTIEFLESFLPPPTTTKKKIKRKPNVRGRLDEIDIDD